MLHDEPAINVACRKIRNLNIPRDPNAPNTTTAVVASAAAAPPSGLTALSQLGPASFLSSSRGCNQESPRQHRLDTNSRGQVVRTTNQGGHGYFAIFMHSISACKFLFYRNRAVGRNTKWHNQACCQTRNVPFHPFQPPLHNGYLITSTYQMYSVSPP